MANYFEISNYLSASKLKEFCGSFSVSNKRSLASAFEFGTLVHKMVLEPHLISDEDRMDERFEIAQKMTQTIESDYLVNDILNLKGAKSEFEFYRRIDGIYRKCKTDKWLPEQKIILELKTLSIGTNKALLTSINRFWYDMSAAWYIDITGAEVLIIVAVSKTHPQKIFKHFIFPGDEIYKAGKEKYINAIKMGLRSGELNDTYIYNRDKMNSWLARISPHTSNSAHII